ncbi:stage III sporulation protein AA [Mechercharimyces sp. CAU 1602]|uniref:stage III sporulation protein AA n=1 Tax=Mechercharimyces sp. CAU 1602 TaxID=2973933 RepID=UPI0037CC8BA8
MKPVLEILPLTVRNMVQSLPNSFIQQLEEIRIRQQRPLEMIFTHRACFIDDKGRLTQQAKEAYLPSQTDCHKMLNLVSNHSLYAMEEELKRGYVTIPGGHRIGLAGKVVMEHGVVRHLRDVTGFNVRIARQVKGVGQSLISSVIHKEQVENLLIISPPQCGKTTLLRDLARLTSNGHLHRPAYKVGIVDERSEIAGCVYGVPQHDVGVRTDVLDGCSKAEGMMMMIRSMSPDVLVVDEIGRTEDGEAIHEAIYAGVRCFTTAHGFDLKDACRRPVLSSLIREGVFTRYVVLSRRQGPGTVEGVYDQERRRLILPGQPNQVAESS